MVKEKISKKSAPKSKISDADLKTKEDLQVKLNRLYAKRTALEKHLKTRANSQRLQRTRTLIQLGGLVSKSSLMELCDITEGDDLQTDIPNLDKAAILLGILSEAMHQLTEKSGAGDSGVPFSPLTSEQQDKFRKIGKRLLKG